MRRAIGAHDIVLIAHGEEDMRVIERRQLAFAHEFPRADLDHGNARRVVKVRDDRFRHLLCPCSPVAARPWRLRGRQLARACAPAARHHSHPVNRWLGKSSLVGNALLSCRRHVRRALVDLFVNRLSRYEFAATCFGVPSHISLQYWMLDPGQLRSR